VLTVVVDAREAGEPEPLELLSGPGHHLFPILWINPNPHRHSAVAPMPSNSTA